MFDKGLPQQMYGFLPNVFDVTLVKKISRGSSPDAAAAGITVSARKRNIDLEELAKANITYVAGMRAYSVFDDGNNPNFQAPEYEDSIIDNGQEYIVKYVTGKILDTLYSCICVQGW